MPKVYHEISDITSEFSFSLAFEGLDARGDSAYTGIGLVWSREIIMTINVYAAKTQLSHLIDEAAAGKEIIIARAGKPVAKLVPLHRQKRRLGILKGKLSVPADFDAPLAGGLLALFEKR